MPGYRIIDADGHMIEPADMWQRHVEESYRHRAPMRIKDQYGMVRFVIEDRLVPKPEGYGAGSRYVKAILRHPESGKPVEGAFDPKERLKDMDEEGVDVAVLYGTDGLLILAAQDPALATALAIGFNNWLESFCRTDPQRLKGAAVLPLQDVGEAVKELRRAVGELGMVAGVIPYHTKGKDLSHPDFYPLWDEAQRLDVAITVHAGSNLPHPGQNDLFWNSFFMTHALCHPFSQMVACLSMVGGGVLELFPRLRVAFLEAGCGWAPYLLERMDEHYEKFPREEAPLLKKRPSEYVREHGVYFACAPEEETLPYVAEFVGAEHVVFATDYPHFDAPFPHSVKMVAERGGLSEETKKKVLGGNALKLYKLNQTT